MFINELKLAKELIRRPSVTPKDAGSINLIAKNLRSLGFKCQMMNFKNIKNLYAKLGKSSPNFCYAGHTDVVPVGDLKSWSVKARSSASLYQLKYGHLAIFIQCPEFVNFGFHDS